MYQFAIFLLTVFLIIFGLHISALFLLKKLKLKKNKYLYFLFKKRFKVSFILTTLTIFFILIGNVISSQIIVNLSFMWIVLILYTSIFIILIQIITFFLKIPSNLKVKILIVLLILLFSYGFWNANQITIKTIQLETKKISQDYTAVFISDIHLGSRDVSYFNKIITKIKEINPDFLMIGGDLIDMHHITPKDLNSLNTLNITKYFIYGNHESYEQIEPNFFQNISNLNILDNNYTYEKDFQIIGLNPYIKNWGKHVSLTNLLNKTKIDNSFYTIILTHESDGFDYFLEKKIDLVLSGHTHRGQIFPFNLITKLRYKYNYGLYDKKETIIYTSSGVGTWGPKLRIGSKNEIIIIEFRKI
jgi:uncharacterized protein